jgi:putative flippase GtrA
MSGKRVAAFATVGAMGFGVQLVTLAALTSVAGWPYLLATCAAVETAVLHNFLWHERWTWFDRRSGASTRARRLTRFNLTTGLTSIAGNIVLMALFVQVLGVEPITANALTVASLTLVNFLVADTWVFAARAVIVAILMCASVPASAEPRPDTIAAWNAFVSATETRIRRDTQHPRGSSPTELNGETIAIAGGTIHHWTGGVFVRGVTLKTMLCRLLNPGTPPPQEDVVDARVLSRSGNDSRRVYLRVSRRTIVSATYDTEHDVTFERLSPVLATSRSVATRIAEVGGDDRGFMWRLNSYWRYQETSEGVLVEMESLTLSRDVPAIVRPIAMPLVSRVARESVRRTLDAFTNWFQQSGQATLHDASRSARTTTPAPSRAARIFAARSSEPGVSPWTQMVSACRVSRLPSDATTDRSVTIFTARDTTAFASWMTEPGFRRDIREPSGS